MSKRVCSVQILYKQNDVSFFIDPRAIESVVGTVLAIENARADFLSITFLSDRQARYMHKKYFKDPSSTDCMTFPIDEEPSPGPRYLGDIFICPKTAAKIALEDTNAFFKELTLYTVHGMLHLLGYTDTTSLSRTIMKKKEKIIMNILSIKGLLFSGNREI